MYWFTNSYRKKEAKFQNYLLNDKKRAGIDCCYSRAFVRRVHTAHRIVATKTAIPQQFSPFVLV